MDLEHISGSNNHLEARPELIDGSRSSKHSEPHPEAFERSGSGEHSKAPPDVIDMSDGKQSSISEKDPVNEGNPNSPAKSSGPSSSSSSSSSDLLSEDLFQVGTIKDSKFAACTTSFPKPDNDTAGALKDEIVVSGIVPPKSDERDNSYLGPASTSQVSDISRELVMHGALPTTQAPQVQVMDLSGGYDPYRIPSSVFARSKSTTPMEWSVASNESLFSIHIGNTSFSKDHLFLFGEFKPDELNKSGEFIMFSPTSPGPPAEDEKKSIKIGVESGATLVADETAKDAVTVSAEARSEQKVPTPAVYSSFSRHSDDSGSSRHSFAFPILAEEESGYLETDGEKSQQEPLAPKITSNSTAKCCSPCFSWCPWGCSYGCC